MGIYPVLPTGKNKPRMDCCKTRGLKMLPGFGCWAPARQNQRSAVRSWRKDRSSICEWARNILKSKAFSCLLGWRAGNSGTLCDTHAFSAAHWEGVICELGIPRGLCCTTQEARCEMGQVRRRKGWEKKLHSSWYSTWTLGKWPTIFALNFSIRSTLLEFLLNYTNHLQDPGHLDEKMFCSPPFPLSLDNEGA